MGDTDTRHEGAADPGLSADPIRVRANGVTFFEWKDQSCVLLDEERPTWLKTSGSGRWIFERAAEEQISLERLVAATAEHYGLPAAAVDRPVRDFVAALGEHGFLEGREPRAERPFADDLPGYGLHGVWFNILTQCNLACSHCFMPENPGSKPISVEAAAHILEILAKQGVQRLYLSGGEPLLHPELPEIVRRARALSDWKLFVVTNASTERGELVDDLADQVDWFQVSVDGIDAATHDALRAPGSFARAIGLIQRVGARASRAKTCLSFTPHPTNVDQIPQLFRFAMQAGARAVYVTKPKRPARNHPGRDPHIEEFLSAAFRARVLAAYDELVLSYCDNARGLATYRDVTLPEIDSGFDPAVNLLLCARRACCGAGGTTLFVDEKGDCYPCSALVRPDCRLGNLLEEPFEVVYGERSVKGFRQRIHVDRIEECRGCPYRYFCAGDCRALTDDVLRRTPYCEQVRERYDRFLRLVRPGLRRS